MSKVHCVFFRKVTQIQNFDSNSILGGEKKLKKHWFGFEPGYFFELVKCYF